MDIISSGIVTVSPGVSSAGLSIIQEGILEILNDGVAQEIALSDGGKAIVSSGGILYVCMVSPGGTATVLNRGFAQDITVAGGLFLVSSGGTAQKSLLQSGGTQIVCPDAMAAAATVLNGGAMYVSSAAYALDPVVSTGGVLYAWNGALVDRARIAGSACVNASAAMNSAVLLDDGVLSVLSAGYAFEAAVSSGGTLDVSSGGIINSARVYAGGAATVSAGARSYNTEVNSGGAFLVFSGTTATAVRENGGYVAAADGANVTFTPNVISNLLLENAATIHSGTTATDTAVSSEGVLYIFSGGTANNTSVNSAGTVYVSSGGKLTGKQTFEAGAVVSMAEGAILDFDLTRTEAGALVSDLSIIQGMPLYTLTVSGAEADGTYTLAEGAAGFISAITVQNTLGETYGVLTADGETVFVGDTGYTLDLTESILSVVVGMPGPPAPGNLAGTKDRVSWDPVEVEGYVVEYSTDGFAHTLKVDATGNAVDILDLPAGTYQWRVKADVGKQWAVGNEIVSDNDNTPKVLQSNADGSDDLFFAVPAGTWGDDGCLALALHTGSVNDWTGTREIVSADGKGCIRNLFFGSADQNVLCLTDTENGDAIFVDDVYTDLPEDVEEHMARLYQIREIRAGAGADIVDMTSQRFEYVGEGMTIRGGDGNDVIWANRGDNILFGDAGDDRIVGASRNDVFAGGIGNDRMHGGGGDDVFTFCDNWGSDTVEQLESGKVTLWFASGDVSNWDETTLTYTDGDNSVSVKGVAAASVILKFGENSPADAERFAMLSGLGAFEEFTMRRIFEETSLFASP